ncbi:MAG: AEC family transporter [Granulosicoccus sp.]|nr:AEC family transporter [Granulosicoccus sp.]
MTELALEIINILAPSVLIALIGLTWFHKGPVFPVDFATTLVLNISGPAFMFYTLASLSVPVATLGKVALATLVVHIVFAFAAITVLKVCRKDIHLCMSFVVGNTGNLGLPVCFFAFGNEGLAYAMTFFSVQCLLLFSMGDALYAGSLNVGRVLRSPILHAIWIGLLINAIALPVPDAVMNSTELLGQILIPLMLLTLGYSLASMRANQLWSTIRWSALRTLMAVVVGFGISELIALEGVARSVVIVQTVVPVAVFNYLLTLKHGHDVSEVSGMILVTHLAAIVYLPIVLGVLLQ